MEINKEGMNINEAIAEIHGIIGQTSRMGAQDYEPEALRNLIKNLNNGTITPNDAVIAARKIRDRKQAYQ